MSRTGPSPSLYVEGKNDLHSIIHLVGHFGVDYDTKPWPQEYPKLKEAGSIEKLLDGVETSIKAATGSTVGFVLDADSPLKDRWAAIRDRLRKVDVTCDDDCDPEGLIAESTILKVRVGVWLMPDNVHDGKLETFLHELISENDPLMELSQESADEALNRGAAFSELDKPKATMHAWLAWQEDPGLPYGTAIKAKYFEHDRPAGNNFAKWFKELFEIS